MQGSDFPIKKISIVAQNNIALRGNPQGRAGVKCPNHMYNGQKAELTS